LSSNLSVQEKDKPSGQSLYMHWDLNQAVKLIHNASVFLFKKLMLQKVGYSVGNSDGIFFPGHDKLIIDGTVMGCKIRIFF